MINRVGKNIANLVFGVGMSTLIFVGDKNCYVFRGKRDGGMRQFNIFTTDYISMT